MTFIMSTKERKKESMNERLKDMKRKSDGVAGSHSSLSVGYRDRQTDRL
jgi:hypothetical protein